MMPRRAVEACTARPRERRRGVADARDLDPTDRWMGGACGCVAGGEEGGGGVQRMRARPGRNQRAELSRTRRKPGLVAALHGLLEPVGDTVNRVGGRARDVADDARRVRARRVLLAKGLESPVEQRLKRIVVEQFGLHQEALLRHDKADEHARDHDVAYDVQPAQLAPPRRCARLVGTSRVAARRHHHHAKEGEYDPHLGRRGEEAH
eukprot:1412130-Prymnesium_polylepis.1